MLTFISILVSVHNRARWYGRELITKLHINKAGKRIISNKSTLNSRISPTDNGRTTCTR